METNTNEYFKSHEKGTKKMKIISLLLFVFLSDVSAFDLNTINESEGSLSVIGSTSIQDDDDFWNKCPGPACPSNTIEPDISTVGISTPSITIKNPEAGGSALSIIEIFPEGGVEPQVSSSAFSSPIIIKINNGSFKSSSAISVPEK